MINTPETRAAADAAARVRMLREVNTRKTTWNPEIGQSGGFIRTNRRAYQIVDLIALHQLNADGALLIAPSGQVYLTPVGRGLLADPNLKQGRGVA